MMTAMAAAVPNILTQGRREKEAEMIWRGNQYKRAIRMYVRKYGRYPQSLDDLIKEQQGQVRYLRQLYKDPMNPGGEGKWRFIYVTQGGMLIGSVRYLSLQQLALADQHGGILPASMLPGTPGSPANAIGTPGTSPSGANASQSGSFQSGSTNSAGNAPGQNPFGMNGQQPPGQGFLGTGTVQGLSAQQPQPLSGDVIGGNIIGVASKVEKPSLKVYRGGKKYKEWEFIFDPLAQTMTIGGQVGTGIQGGTNPGQPITGPGSTPPNQVEGNPVQAPSPPDSPPPSNPQQQPPRY
jgi:hypothetical protein